MKNHVISVCGVAGSGKTAFSKAISKATGYPLIELGKIVAKPGLHASYDDSRQTLAIDPQRLLESISPITKPAILDGVFSHLMRPTHVIVLLCEPTTLFFRLEKRGYPKKKIMENIEAQHLGTLTIESIEACANVLELDSTSGAGLQDALEWMRMGGVKLLEKDWDEAFMRLLVDRP